MKLNGIATLATFLLAGCAHSSVVLLPDEGGGHGEIAIRPASGQGGETVMRDANSRATLTGARYNTNGRDENWFNWSLVNFAINFF